MRLKMKDSRSNKFNAVARTVDGIRFDSTAESRRYMELKLMQAAGEITGLTCHPQFELIPGAVIDGQKIQGIKYTADFAYIEHGTFIVEDVKGDPTRDYELRRKMMLLLRGIKVREIDAETLKEREWTKSRRRKRIKKECLTT